MFKEGTEKQKPEARPNGNAGEAALSIIATGMTVVGDIDSSGVVRVEGKIKGRVRSSRQVLVGRNGEVHGDIETREALIGGKVQGTVTASDRTEVQGTAVVNGDINTKSIVVLEGARLNGAVNMQDVVAAETGEVRGKVAAVG